MPGTNFRAYIISAVLFLGLSSSATAEETHLYEYEPLVITAAKIPSTFSDLTRNVAVIEREDILGSGAHSVDELLEYVAGVDVKKRGAYGVQSDVSIRGSTFEQTLILIDGVKVSDPQTGHHNLNVPITLDEIDRIEVLKGHGSKLYGPNAFGGVINIITNESSGKSASVNFTGGEYGLKEGNASISSPLGVSGHRFSVSKKTSDGYRENTDFDVTNISYGLSLDFAPAEISASVGYIDKEFGANGFYSDRYPNQWEHTKSMFVNSGVDVATDPISFSTALYWRTHNDDFVLDKERPDWYRNIHTTDVYGAEVKSEISTILGGTAFGGEVGKEEIVSTNLGDHYRYKGGIFVEHQIGRGKVVTIVPGLFAYSYTDWGWQVWPGIDGRVRVSERTRVYGSVGKSFRVPTFTELHYDSPANQGNPDLRPEEAWSYEVGAKYLGDIISGNVCGFRRDGRNLIDWVRADSSEPWRALNIAEMNTDGIEAGSEFRLSSLVAKSPVTRITASYTYLTSDKSAEGFESKYVLDYLEHQSILKIDYKIIDSVRGNWKMRYEDRVQSDEHLLVDARIAWEFGPLELFAEASNLLDTEYEDIGSVPMPGRWLRGGVTYSPFGK